MKEDCIFCKIANGIIPSATVYEDRFFRAIFDIAPAAKGHVLILTKEHYDNALELDDETAAKVFVVAAKIAKAMKEEYQCDGINILQNNGTAAGQTVFHFHVHLIPRYEDDEVGLSWNQLETDGETLAEMANSLNARILNHDEEF
ncbi:MAG: HIT family protein [Lachnospiraceae bacterium]